MESDGVGWSLIQNTEWPIGLIIQGEGINVVRSAVQCSAVQLRNRSSGWGHVKTPEPAGHAGPLLPAEILA
jgi:hypothetical protein